MITNMYFETIQGACPVSVSSRGKRIYADGVEFQQKRQFWNYYATIYDKKKAPFDSYLRETNLKILQNNLKKGMQVLEIGCGTGTEAYKLVNLGINMTLTDLSSTMLEKAQQKLGTKVEYINIPAENIDKLTSKYDAAFASFGVLNCIGNLKNFVQKLYDILNTKSVFICTVINKWYWGDFLLFLLHKGNYLKLRLKGYGKIIVDRKEYDVTAKYYSVNDIKEIFKPEFKVIKHYSLPVVLPPPYLNPKEKLNSKIFSFLEFFEKFLYDKPIFNLFGEQIIFIMKKK